MMPSHECPHLTPEQEKKLMIAVEGTCEFCCEYSAFPLLVIHRISRRLYREMIRDPSARILVVCRHCHDHIHRLPVPVKNQRAVVARRSFFVRRDLRRALGYQPKIHIPPDNPDLAVMHEDYFYHFPPGSFRLNKQEGGGGSPLSASLPQELPHARDLSQLSPTKHKYHRSPLLPMREPKSTIRKKLREQKDAMIPEDRLLKSRAICRHLMALIRDHETVMAYTSKEKEVNTVPIITRLLERKNPVVVPIIVREDVSLRLSYLRDFSALVPSTFGVPEPIGSEIPARGEDVDTIILPMLGFDRSGGRIGYGAGYYDRFLEKHPHLRKIGIAFACQEIDSLPLDGTDVRMDDIITEDGVVYP